MFSISNKNINILVSLFVLIYIFVVIRSAWVAEDAYITFRTVDNFINGYGLTWNVGERVQAFTNPLMMFSMSFLYFFTREIYFTNIIFSILVSLGAVLMVVKISKSYLSAILGISLLVFSRAFIDYSTSGLENPFTHLILALFFFIFLKKTEVEQSKKLFWLTLITSLLIFNRMDTVLLVFPALSLYIVKVLLDKQIKFKKLVSILALGFSPFIIWELFSLIYYGFLFPNTAYAKLNTGIESTEYIKQGILYLFESISRDPITLLVITFAIVLSIILKDRKLLVMGLGVALYILYIIKVGGGFMSGRFLAAPFFLSILLIVQIKITNNKNLLLLTVILFTVGINIPNNPMLSDASYDNRSFNANGIADERGYYYQDAGLLNSVRTLQPPNHKWALEGTDAKNSNENMVIIRGNIGYFGFNAGPKVFIIDELALSDPLLARLPAHYNENWRIGHFHRIVPEGYVESIQQNRNLLKDQGLKRYYDRLTVITRGDIFSWERFKTIVHMNLGHYDYLIDRDKYRHGS